MKAVHYAWIGVVVASFFFIEARQPSLRQRFTNIYNKKFWQWNDETVSGMGSSLEHTETVRGLLPKLLSEFSISSVLDAPCGDFNWMRLVVSDNLTYIGVDIVEDLVRANKGRYGAENISFIQADITKDELPSVDLILCRDCLAHLSFKNAFGVLKNFKKSGSKYLLITTYTNEDRNNIDISDEGYENYTINLEKPPFDFPRPLSILRENNPQTSALDKCLALWRLEDLNLETKSAVTYDTQWGGRFGDQTLMYVKARWIAYKVNLPFYYKPFKYSDQLMMHELDVHWAQSKMKKFVTVENICTTKMRYRDLYVNVDKYIKRNKKILYEIHYYFHPHNWGVAPELYDSQEVSMWRDMLADEEFCADLRRVIQPRGPIETLNLPKDMVTVAVHVRKGGGFDTPLFSVQLYGDEKKDFDISCHCEIGRMNYIDCAYPLKFPPDLFYVTQIKRVSNLYHNVPMYVHIFTDDSYPEKLVERYKSMIDSPNITFGCRQSGNCHDKNVLEDLFSMAQFDCLIRSGSNFPQIAQLIGNHKVVIYPKGANWKSVLVVDDVGIMQSDA